jgi:hypothetical protein
MSYSASDAEAWPQAPESSKPRDRGGHETGRHVGRNFRVSFGCLTGGVHVGGIIVGGITYAADS